MQGAYSGGFLSSALPLILIVAAGLLLLLFTSIREGLISSFWTISEDLTGRARPSDDEQGMDSPQNTDPAALIELDEAKVLEAERESLGLPQGWAVPRSKES